MERRIVFLALAAMCLLGTAVAQAPSLISYQGKLVDSDGVPVTGTHDLQFDVYTSPTGGASLWTETLASVTITAGLFNVTLGETTAFGVGLFDSNPQLWLEVTLDGSETFTRVRLVSAPFAIEAQSAAALAGLGASQFLRSDTNAAFSGGTLEVGSGSTLNVAGTLQLGGATVSATAAQLNELVGGGVTTLHSHPGGGGDADTLDGLDSLQFLRSDANATYSGGTLQVAGGSTFDAAGTFQLGGATVNATAAQLNELVGGAATTLHSHAPGDADTLDMLDSGQFLRSDANDTCAGAISFTGTTSGINPLQAAVYIQPNINSPGDSLFGVYKDASNMVSINDPGDLTVSGIIQGGTILIPAGYNRFGNSTPSSGEITGKNDVLVSDDLEVKGDLVWGTKTNFYSMNGTNFVTLDSGYSFHRAVNTINKMAGSVSSQSWIGQVNLPDGAVVTGFTVWYYDNHSDNLQVTLYRVPLGGSATGSMASVTSSGTPGEGTATDTSISNATIDNDTHHYYVYFSFSANDTSTNLRFRNARIRYTTTGP